MFFYPFHVSILLLQLHQYCLHPISNTPKNFPAQERDSVWLKGLKKNLNKKQKNKENTWGGGTTDCFSKEIKTYWYIANKGELTKITLSNKNTQTTYLTLTHTSQRIFFRIKGRSRVQVSSIIPCPLPSTGIVTPF